MSSTISVYFLTNEENKNQQIKSKYLGQNIQIFIKDPNFRTKINYFAAKIQGHSISLSIFKKLAWKFHKCISS